MDKKVLLITPFMTGFGGTETVISNLFKKYNDDDSNKITLDYVNIGGFTDDVWQNDIKNKKVIKLSENKYARKLEYLFFLPFIIFYILKKYNPNLVISTNPVIWSISYLLKPFLKNKYSVVSWYHYSLTAKPIKKFMLKKADYYLSISTGITKELEKDGISEDKISTIYNPVLPSNLEIKKSNDGTCRFVYVGRVMLNGQKNIKEMIDALSLVKGNWTLDIIGSGEINKVKNYIKEKKINPSRIKFYGFKSNPWDFIKYADFLILSSKYEGFPMTLNEAISRGLPVVSSNCPTGPEDIVNINNGVLYEMGNVNELRDILQKVVNGEIVFKNQKDIKNSINDFYIYNYYNKFVNTIIGYMNK